MTSPRAALKLGPERFGARWACEGGQVADVANQLEESIGPLEWWVADVFPEVGVGSSHAPVRFGTTAAFAAWAASVGQFEAGVFIATRPGAPASSVADTVSSDDDPWRDMAGAHAEIRAFDTSYLDVVLADVAAAQALATRFRVELEIR